MTKGFGRAATGAIALGLLTIASAASAETLLTLDARAQPPAAESGYLRMGTATSPSGHVIGLDNRYLSLDGHPWLPVMGEFHYARFPAAYWDEELAKMKASGVDIVSTYVFWNHHEEVPGQFDWTGDRDLRRFVALCARHDLKVIIRLGPWAHGESRFGGIPDWVVNQVPPRTDDPTYLGYVERFWGQIRQQLDGQLWKDGGPVIGVQLENEYNLTGQGQGRAHIAALKAMALRLGFDTPLYTVTGWDQTVYPPREVSPVFGGYPDEPWGVSTARLPPKETYAFRFDSRVSGNLGAQTQSAAGGDADPDIPHTAFLGAEFGGGAPTMYRRRPVFSPDDIAAMLPVQLGSGVNLYGYYMFQGGRNPEGRTSLEENTAIGGYNDTPLIDYDFQAPLGEYGQVHAVLDRLRPYHYFLRAFGADLAPMAPHRPQILPKDLNDLTTPRFSVRSAGDAGFLFVNNHVRQYPMAAQTGVRFQVELPGGALAFPRRPIDIPPDAYFIWPINMDLGAARLRYATAQPITRLATTEGPLYVFRAVDGIVPEFAIETKGARVSAASGHVNDGDQPGVKVVEGLRPGAGAVITLHPASGPAVRILVLTEAQAQSLWLGDLDGQPRLILTRATPVFGDHRLELRSLGDPDIRISVYPALKAPPAGLTATGRDGLFQTLEARQQTRALTATFTHLRDAQPVPPVTIGGPARAAVQPTPEVYGRAAAWSLTIPKDALSGLSDAYLDLSLTGDVGRLFSGPRMLDDHFLDGRPWQVGLKRFASLLDQPLILTVLPLRGDAPIYLQEGYRPALTPGAQVAEVRQVTLTPEYSVTVSFAGR
ncbi:MAG: beta-galactosidase [Caulobacteraceae bacterium]|nr:beta-galactosidase [Caulobacteraceae bacterium]